MQGHLALQAWLEVLRSIAPIKGLLHVGAGAGGDVSRYAGWGVKQAIFVEADEGLASALTAVVDKQPNWHAVTALVHDRDDEQDFYLASNHDQSGVLHPERFSGIWRNLKAMDQRRIKTVTLDGILGASAADVAPNWAVIDCLPALPILRGATGSLEQWDVILARVLLEEEQVSGVGAGKSELDAYLADKGFRCMTWQEDMQPAIGQVVYVRDWKAVVSLQLNALRGRMEAEARSYAQSLRELVMARDEQAALVAKAKEEQTKHAAECQARIEELAQARDAEAHTALERQRYVEHLSQERDALLDATSAAQLQLYEQKTAVVEKDRLAGERLKEIERLTKAQEEHARIVADHDAKIKVLTKDRDEQVRLVAESRQRTEQLTKAHGEKDEIANKIRNQFEDASKALAAVTQLADERRLEVEKLIQALDEKNARAVDLQSQLGQLGKVKDEQSQMATKYQEQADRLATERDEQFKLLENEKVQVEKLIKIRDEQNRLAIAQQEEIKRLTKESDQCIKLADERRQQVEELSKANDAQSSLIKEYQEHVEQLTNSKNEHVNTATKYQIWLETVVKEYEAQLGLASEHKLQVETLSRELAEQREGGADLRSQLEWASKEKEDLNRLVTQCRKQVEQLTQEREEQIKLALERQSTLEKAIVENAKQIVQLPELLKAQEGRLEKMENGLKSHFSKSMENSTKQLESIIAIESYLTHDQLLPSFHGWPVSPDFALYLIRLIEANDYDLIVEFGSGATTLLTAQSLERKLQRERTNGTLHLELETRTQAKRGRPDEHVKVNPHVLLLRDRALSSLPDLSPRIVTFEHDRKYYKETLNSLKKAGVERHVELNHTPLREYVSDSDERMLYYSCEEKVAEHARMLTIGRQRILLLVDGPPAATGRHARYPALPIVLQSLAAHQIDVLLDDFNRQEEKEIIERWSEMLEKRSINYQKTKLAFEKGACLLSIG